MVAAASGALRELRRKTLRLLNWPRSENTNIALALLSILGAA